MSLINDALKQARQSQQQDAPSGQPSFRPTAHAPSGTGNWPLVLVVVLLAGAAAFFIGLAVARHKPPQPLPVAKASSVTTPSPSPPISAPVPQATVAPAASAAPVAVPTAAPPEIPQKVEKHPMSIDGIKLQGVIYGQKSWAIVNGKTVYVGDSVGDFHVKEIFPDSIMLESPNGSQQKVRLGQ